MDEELVKLLEQISSLDDDSLLRMINQNSAQYRPEAITFAKVVMARRGFSFRKNGKVINKPAAAKQRGQRQASVSSEPDRELKSETCPRCNGKLDYIGTRRLHEEKSLGVLGELGQMFKDGAPEFLDVYTCRQCGRVELFVDGIGEDIRPS